jgi:predicted small metal-binding protein
MRSFNATASINATDAGGHMARTLKCGELVSECEEILEGVDIDEVLSQAREHLVEAHGLAEISGYLEARLWAAIRGR